MRHIYTEPLVQTGQKPKQTKIVRYFICGDYCKIYLGNNSSFLIDTEFLDEIKNFSWNIKHYVFRVKEINKSKHVVFLHKQIMRADKNQMVDHINGDKLDNRKHNLRFCTRQQNSFNRKKPEVKRCTSRYKGVSSNGKNWCARISVNGKTIYLGTFSTEEQAAAMYNKLSKELHGEYGRLNQINM